MDEENWIFMTKTQALNAIAFDFQQYDNQSLLLCRLAPLILDHGCQVIDKGDYFSLGVTQAGDKNKHQNYLPEGIAKDNLIFYFIHALETKKYPLQVLADICSLTFQTRTCVGKSAESRRQGIWIEHNMEQFICRQCGECCKNLAYENDCTKEDYLVWQELERQDILDQVLVIKNKGNPDRYRIWVNPATGTLFRTCPWLLPQPHTNKYLCRIQEAKPEICRQYPFTSKHAKMTGCLGEFKLSSFF